jgi:uncharacterized protein with ParB-like and HNH nuclease domain
MTFVTVSSVYLRPQATCHSNAPITVAEAIRKIESRQYFLPAIQREFVWGTDQIEILFDSLTQDYPIGSFLFWRVDKGNVGSYQFYEFIKNYHEAKNTHNPKAAPNQHESLTAILDGQQRLTALYIGLKGSYAAKLKYKRKQSEDAYPKTHPYLNLIATSDKPEREFDLRFLSEKEARKETQCLRHGLSWR